MRAITLINVSSFVLMPLLEGFRWRTATPSTCKARSPMKFVLRRFVRDRNEHDLTRCLPSSILCGTCQPR